MRIDEMFPMFPSSLPCSLLLSPLRSWRSPAMQTVQLGSYLGAVKLFMPFLFTYAIAFNAIPLFRAFRMKSANAKINQRNKTRRLWRSVLENGGEKVQRKLRAAKKVRWWVKVNEGRSSPQSYSLLSRPIPVRGRDEERLKEEGGVRQWQRFSREPGGEREEGTRGIRQEI